jgi:hypothetical protein
VDAEAVDGVVSVRVQAVAMRRRRERGTQRRRETEKFIRKFF